MGRDATHGGVHGAVSTAVKVVLVVVALLAVGMISFVGGFVNGFAYGVKTGKLEQHGVAAPEAAPSLRDERGSPAGRMFQRAAKDDREAISMVAQMLHVDEQGQGVWSAAAASSAARLPSIEVGAEVQTTTPA